jgi:hypothetical protein
MNTFLNYNKEEATINLKDFLLTDQDLFKSFEQLTCSEKQSIASKFVNDHVLYNVNEVVQSVLNNYESEYFDQALSLSELKDFESVVTDHINDLEIDQIVDIIKQYNLEYGANVNELYKTTLLNDLISAIDCTNFDYDELLFNVEFITGLSEEKYTIEFLENKLKDIFKNKDNSLSFDELDSLCNDLSIKTNGYFDVFKTKLVDLVLGCLDFEQYGQDNDLEPDYYEAYEFYLVTDHFKAVVGSDNIDEILGLEVWARFCTGQAICLDHDIQIAAFKSLSDCWL